jgi:N-acetylglutamate synthase-like GNAT family acetyltransferase
MRIVKGQKLWVRPAISADAAEIDAFLRREEIEPPPHAEVLIGRLVGSIVASAFWRRDGASFVVLGLCVATEMRRKRVGRAMLMEIEKLAAGMHSQSVIAPRDSAVAGYLLSRGFEPQGEWIVKAVRNPD